MINFDNVERHRSPKRKNLDLYGDLPKRKKRKLDRIPQLVDISGVSSESTQISQDPCAFDEIDDLIAELNQPSGEKDNSLDENELKRNRSPDQPASLGSRAMPISLEDTPPPEKVMPPPPKVVRPPPPTRPHILTHPKPPIKYITADSPSPPSKHSKSRSPNRRSSTERLSAGWRMKDLVPEVIRRPTPPSAMDLEEEMKSPSYSPIDDGTLSGGRGRDATWRNRSRSPEELEHPSYSPVQDRTPEPVPPPPPPGRPPVIPTMMKQVRFECTEYRPDIDSRIEERPRRERERRRRRDRDRTRDRHRDRDRRKERHSYFPGRWKFTKQSWIRDGLSTNSSIIRAIDIGEVVNVVSITEYGHRIRGQVAEGFVTLYNKERNTSFVTSELFTVDVRDRSRERDRSRKRRRRDRILDEDPYPDIPGEPRTLKERVDELVKSPIPPSPRSHPTTAAKTLLPPEIPDNNNILCDTYDPNTNGGGLSPVIYSDDEASMKPQPTSNVIDLCTPSPPPVTPKPAHSSLLQKPPPRNLGLPKTIIASTNFFDDLPDLDGGKETQKRKEKSVIQEIDSRLAPTPEELRKKALKLKKDLIDRCRNWIRHRDVAGIGVSLWTMRKEKFLEGKPYTQWAPKLKDFLQLFPGFHFPTPNFVSLSPQKDPAQQHQQSQQKISVIRERLSSLKADIAADKLKQNTTAVRPVPPAPQQRHKIVTFTPKTSIFKRPCKYFANGYCRRGIHCQFQHGDPKPAQILACPPTPPKPLQPTITPRAQSLPQTIHAPPDSNTLPQSMQGNIPTNKVVDDPIAALFPPQIPVSLCPPQIPVSPFPTLATGHIFNQTSGGIGRGNFNSVRGRGRGAFNSGSGRGTGSIQDEVKIKTMVAKMVEEMIAPLKNQAKATTVGSGRGEFTSGTGRGRGEFHGRGRGRGRGDFQQSRGRGNFPQSFRGRGRGDFRGRGSRGNAEYHSAGRGRGRDQQYHSNEWEQSFDKQKWNDGHWNQGNWKEKQGTSEDAYWRNWDQSKKGSAPPVSNANRAPVTPLRRVPPTTTAKNVSKNQSKIFKAEEKVQKWRVTRGKDRSPTPRMLHDEAGVSHLEARTIAKRKFKWEPMQVVMTEKEIMSWGKTLKPGTIVTPLYIWNKLRLSWADAKKWASRLFNWKKSEMKLSDDDIIRWFYESNHKTVTPIILMMHLCMSLETSMIKAQKLFKWQPADGEDDLPVETVAEPAPTEMTDQQIIQWCREQPHGTRITPGLLEKKFNLKGRVAQNIARAHFGWQGIDDEPILAWARTLRSPKLPTPKLVSRQFGIDFNEALIVTKRLFSYSEHHESAFDFVNSLKPGTVVTPFLLMNKNAMPPKVARRFAQKYCKWDPSIKIRIDILKDCATNTGFRCGACEFKSDSLTRFTQHMMKQCLHKQFFNVKISPDPGCIAFTTGCWLCQTCKKMYDEFYQIHQHWQTSVSCKRMKVDFDNQEGEFRYWTRKVRNNLHRWTCPCSMEFPHFAALFKHFLDRKCSKGPKLTYNESQMRMLKRWIHSKQQIILENQRSMTSFPKQQKPKFMPTQHQVNAGMKQSIGPGPILSGASSIPGPPGASHQVTRPFHKSATNVANYVQPPEPPRPPEKQPVYQKPPEPPRPPVQQYEQPPPPPQQHYEQPPPPPPPEQHYEQPPPPPTPPVKSDTFHQPPPPSRGTGYPPQNFRSHGPPETKKSGISSMLQSYPRLQALYSKSDQSAAPKNEPSAERIAFLNSDEAFYERMAMQGFQ